MEQHAAGRRPDPGRQARPTATSTRRRRRLRRRTSFARFDGTDDPSSAALGGSIGCPPARRDYVKRVIGAARRPGGLLRRPAAGSPSTARRWTSEPTSIPGDEPSELRFDVEVPAGRLWVMGDHRADSAGLARPPRATPAAARCRLDKVIGRVLLASSGRWTVSAGCRAPARAVALCSARQSAAGARGRKDARDDDRGQCARSGRVRVRPDRPAVDAPPTHRRRAGRRSRRRRRTESRARQARASAAQVVPARAARHRHHRAGHLGAHQDLPGAGVLHPVGVDGEHPAGQRPGARQQARRQAGRDPPRRRRRLPGPGRLAARPAASRSRGGGVAGPGPGRAWSSSAWRPRPARRT